jgi:hypothetical protein
MGRYSQSYPFWPHRAGILKAIHSDLSGQVFSKLSTLISHGRYSHAANGNICLGLLLLLFLSLVCCCSCCSSHLSIATPHSLISLLLFSSYHKSAHAPAAPLICLLLLLLLSLVCCCFSSSHWSTASPAAPLIGFLLLLLHSLVHCCFSSSHKSYSYSYAYLELYKKYSLHVIHYTYLH